MYLSKKSIKLLGLLLILVCTLVRCETQQIAAWRQQKNYAVNALYRHADAASGVALLQKLADSGVTEAHADLLFARLLGTGMTQDLETVAKDSAALVQEGEARAHTTQALLLAHNFTKEPKENEELAIEALYHYTIAAVKGDPLGEIVLAGHYARKGDCDSAMYNYKKAANFAIREISEEIVMSVEVKPYVYKEDYPKGAPKPPSPIEFEYLANLARYGDAQAAFQIGAVLSSGVPGVAKDQKQAAIYLQQAAKGNNTQAMVALANLHLHKMIEPNYAEALKLIKTAFQYGEVGAMTALGRMYMYGLGSLRRNLVEAIHFLEISVANGHLEALYLLGVIYDGPDGPGNMEDAIRLWEIPASLGHVHSAFRLAEAYRKKMEKAPATTLKLGSSYDVSERLCQKAMPLYRLVAMAGEWRHLMEAAYLDFNSGLHTQALLKYLLLSDMGYSEAHVNAARLIDNHADQVYEDENAMSTQSLLSWKRAANSGSPVGHLKLGDLYYYRQDFRKAITYYENAGDLPEALFSLAYMVEWGEGSLANFNAAKTMYESLAEKHGEAQFPVTLTLARMEIFLFLNNTCGIDLYKTPVNDYVIALIDIENLENFTSKLFVNSDSSNWDLLVMALLLVLIFFMLVVRQNNH